MAKQKPFTVKGTNVTSPKGTALWCKFKEIDTTFNDKGTYSVSLVCNPDDASVQQFIGKLEALRDKAYNETLDTLGAKGKGLKRKSVFSNEEDSDGEETGNIIFKFKMNNVLDREKGQDKIVVVDAFKRVVSDAPLVGNGSVIRCVAFANPYYMANTKEVGISLIWSKMQIIDLVEFDGGDEFEEEDGYVADDTPVKAKGKSVVSEDEDEDELDF